MLSKTAAKTTVAKVKNCDSYHYMNLGNWLTLLLQYEWISFGQEKHFK
jgi:hypothetical protein